MLQVIYQLHSSDRVCELIWIHFEYTAVKSIKKTWLLFDLKSYYFATTFLLCFQIWTDEFLVWDPEEFDGINEISLSSDAIWIPDVIVSELWEITDRMSSKLFDLHCLLLPPGSKTVLSIDFHCFQFNFENQFEETLDQSCFPQ